MITRRELGFVPVLLLLLAGSGYADPVTFFGEDLNPASDPSSVMASHTNSDAAHNAFFSNLTGVGTETFDSLPDNTTPTFNASFPGAGTASITDSGLGGVQVVNENDLNVIGNGRFAISGTQFLEVDSNGFAINFNNAGGISAFGFYATDVGDFGGQLTLTLTKLDGTTVILPVNNAFTPGGAGYNPEDGSVLYFGFYDTTQTYKSIAFANSQGGVDSFGFDDFSVGSQSQITSAAIGSNVPEPTSLISMVGLSLIGLIGLRRRQRSC